MRAVQIDEFGGPEVLKLVDIPEPEPGDGQVLIKVTRVGMNFADTHQRENTYLAPYEVPLVLGGEVAGIDPDGRRVIALLANGGYAEYAVAHESMVFPVPDGLGDGEALALLIQGLTAWHLFRTSAKLAPGEAVVVVSGAGGVGSLAVQLAAPFGASRVIATASTPEKRELAVSLGADVGRGPWRGRSQGSFDRGQRRQPGGCRFGDVGWARVRRVLWRPGAVRAPRGVRDRRP